MSTQQVVVQLGAAAAAAADSKEASAMQRENAFCMSPEIEKEMAKIKEDSFAADIASRKYSWDEAKKYGFDQHPKFKAKTRAYVPTGHEFEMIDYAHYIPNPSFPDDKSKGTWHNPTQLGNCIHCGDSFQKVYERPLDHPQGLFRCIHHEASKKAIAEAAKAQFGGKKGRRSRTE